MTESERKALWRRSYALAERIAALEERMELLEAQGEPTQPGFSNSREELRSYARRILELLDGDHL